MNDLTVGQRVKILREELGLTQESFSKRIRRDRTTIGKIETNAIELSPAMRQAICTEFHAKEDWILSGNGEKFANGERESQAFHCHSHAVPPRHPAAAWMPIPPDPEVVGIDPSVQAMSDIKEIFDSGDPILIPAIQANLHAFKRALYRERQIAQILEENKDLKNRMQNLENLCKDIPDLKQSFEELKAENITLHAENNRLKSTYEAPKDGDCGITTDKKAM